MFAGRERSERQLQMKPRRDRDDNSVDTRIVNRGRVVRVTARAAVAATVGFGLCRFAAGKARHDVAAERFQMPAMDACDEAAAQKGNAERFVRGHPVAWIIPAPMRLWRARDAPLSWRPSSPSLPLSVRDRSRTERGKEGEEGRQERGASLARQSLIGAGMIQATGCPLTNRSALPFWAAASS